MATGPSRFSILSFNKLRSRLANCYLRVGPSSSGRPPGDLVSFQTSLRTLPTNQLVIQLQDVRDLVGFDEDRLGFPNGLVSGVLEVVGIGP
jgi:hypothetical protein